MSPTTLFGISSIMTALASLGFGLSVYSSNRGSLANKWWVAMSIAIALWAISLFGVTSVTTREAAALWQYPLDIFAMLIPICYLFFILAFLDRDPAPWRPMFVLTLVLQIISFTSAYRMDMGTQFGFFWINPGPLYILFPVYFGCVTLAATYLLVEAYLIEADALKRAQIRNQMVAGIFGFGGGITNFFPQLFHVYPFGNYFVILYVFLVSYGVLRYRYLSPKLVSAQLFSGAIVLVFMFNLLQSNSISGWFIDFGLFLAVGIFSFFLVQSVYHEIQQREKIEVQEKELERANGQQETLLHFISHEVKGYLTKSEAAFAAIVEGDYGEVRAPLRTMATAALDELRSGVTTVMYILDAANLKRGTMAYAMEQFDIAHCLASLVEELRPLAQGKGIVLRAQIPQEPVLVLGDIEKLRHHVLRNIIDNSIRYTPTGSVDVTLTKLPGIVRLVVQDTGVGITPDDMLRLFTEGGHGRDSLKVNVHSTGYGLFIAKQVTLAHSGRIWAESEGSGKGARFIVEFPAP